MRGGVFYGALRRPAVVFMLSVVALSACQSGNRLSMLAASAGEELVITADQFGQVVAVTVGQRFVVRRPGDFAEWRLDYESSIVETSMSAEEQRTTRTGRLAVSCGR